MKRTIVVIALVLGLLAPAVQADAWGWRPSSGGSEPTPALSTWEASHYSRILESISISQIELRPITRWLVNAVLRKVMPPLCPVLTGLAAPEFQPFVEGSCAGIAASPDPWASVQDFLPLLCVGDPPIGSMVFPSMGRLVNALCLIV